MGDLPAVEDAVPVEEDSLPGVDVFDLAEPHQVEGDALGGEGVGRLDAVIPDPEDQGLDAVGVPEGHHALLRDVGDDGIASLDSLVYALHGLEDVLRNDLADALGGELLGEDVQHGLDVIVGIQEPVVFLEQLLLELAVIDDVAVVGHDDAERRVDQEGLGVLAPAAADRRIAGVPDADMPLEALRVLRREDVLDEAVPLLGVETAAVGDDAGRVLAAVLDGQQALVEIPENIRVAVNSPITPHIWDSIIEVPPDFSIGDSVQLDLVGQSPSEGGQELFRRDGGGADLPHHDPGRGRWRWRRLARSSLPRGGPGPRPR